MKFFKKHKKGLIILAVVAIVIAGIVFWLKSSVKKGMEMLSSSLGTEVATVEKRDLVSVVSGTGKIVSLSQKDVTSAATGAKILKVNVNVGDMVKEGDILVLLDSSDYEESLKSARDSLETAKASNKLSISSAQRRVNEATESGNISDARYDEQIKEAEEKVKLYEDSKKYAENMYTQAAANYNACLTNYNTALAATSASKEAWDTAKTASESAKTEFDAKKTAFDGVVAAGKVAGDTEYDDAKSEMDTAELAYNAAQTTETAAKAAYETALASNNVMALASARDTAQAVVNKWLADISSYSASLDQYKASLSSIEKNRDDAKRANDSSIASSQDSLKSAKLSSENSTTSSEKQIESFEEQIDACTVTAPVSGMVTSVNAVEGNSNSAMGLLTIEDVSAFEISTEIDEYDIGKIKVGQRVVFKTNGTGDEELEGVVKSIAPRASSGMSSSVTYKVIISVLTKNDSLKLDMTAKISIVLEESKNTLTVPYDAISSEEDGREYVNVIDGKNEDGTNSTHKVYVTTGIKSSYYTEILGGDLKEGDEIEFKRETAAALTLSELFMNSGNETDGM